MKTLRFTFLAVLAAVALALTGRAQDTKTQATLLKSDGNVTVKLPGGAALPATPPMKIPEGAVIVTGADGRASIEVHAGIVVSVEKNSNVTVEQLVVQSGGKRIGKLNLKSGSIVSALDPERKNITDYSIVTPRGVAAARGTVLGVSVAFDGGTTVSTMSGLVTLTLAGGQVLQIPFGTAVTPGSGASLALANAIAANPALKDDIAAAVTHVAGLVASGNSAAGANSASTTQTLAAIVGAASAADPGSAATFTKQAVSAATSSTSNTGGNSAAIATITEAAAKAAPNNVNDIVQASANAVTTTKVTEATAGKTGQAAADAAKTAADAAQTINQNTTNVVVAAEASGDPGKAAGIAAAANAGQTAAANATNVPNPAPVVLGGGPGSTTPLSSAPVDNPNNPDIRVISPPGE